MRPNIQLIAMFLIVLINISCTSEDKPVLPRKVEVRKEQGRFILYRNGNPYYIKGASGSKHLAEVVKYGGNSIRTYGGENVQQILDSANKYGLSVTVGLFVSPLKYQFDYSDKVAVKEQQERIKKEVIKFKDHPALLMWAIGNEANLQPDGKPDDQPLLWKAINDIAKMIHEIDPEHPVTTMIPPYSTTLIKLKWYCPELDILSINVFGPIEELQKKIDRPVVGWSKPYIISEWGAPGWWDAKKTLWDAPLEVNSSVKSAVYTDSYNKALLNNPPTCLGSYVFYWGQKQERTSTWFSMFDKKGNVSEAVHAMRYFWNKEAPNNYPPKVESMLLNNKQDNTNIFLDAGSKAEAFINTSDREKDNLEIEWELSSESIMEGFWGENENLPEQVFVKKTKSTSCLEFTAPEKEGPYRLFCHIYDGKGNFATANIPFYVVKE